MQQKDGSIIISDFQKGISKSPVLGNGQIINADIFETQGLFKIGKKLIDDTGFEITPVFSSLPIANFRWRDFAGYQTLQENGILLSTNGGSFGDSFNRADDMLEWNGYHIMSGSTGSGNGTIKVGKIQTSAVALEGWSYVISNLEIAPIYLLKGNDNYVYFTNGNKIGRINSITYNSGTGLCEANISPNVLDLPSDETIVAITELGNNIMVGTQKNVINPKLYTQANLYTWDRNSASFFSPVKLQENGVNSMITKDNMVYVSAGIRGNIYVTNGTSYKLLTTLKTSLSQATSYVYKNAMTFNKDGRLLVGTSTFEDATPNKTTFHGIWEIDTQSGVNHLAYTIPSGELGQNGRITIGYVEYFNGNLYIGYQDGANNKYYIASTSNTLNNLAVFESQVYLVGDYSNKKSFNELQWLFTTPMTTGQCIKIYYRNGYKLDWIKIHESTASHLNQYSTIAKANIANAEVIQFKIELCNTNNSIQTSPELIRILIK